MLTATLVPSADSNRSKSGKYEADGIADLLGHVAAADLSNDVVAAQTFQSNEHPFRIIRVVEGLEQPWSLAFLPNGHKLVTERNGTMRIIDQAGRVSEPLKGLPPFLLAGGHGLADVLLDPEFARNRFIYFSYLAPPAGKPARSMPNDEMNSWLNRPLEDRLKDPMGIPRVARAHLAEDEQRIENLSIILEGGDRRMALANDGTLFVMAETQTSGGVTFVDLRDRTGLVQLVFHPETLKIHGVHIVGENASELVHVGMMVMQFGGTINAFIESVFNFPTLGEAYKYAAYDGLGNVARKRAAAVAEQETV